MDAERERAYQAEAAVQVIRDHAEPEVQVMEMAAAVVKAVAVKDK